jgi:hypothetical protein
MLRVCYNIGETFQSICIGRLGGIEGEIYKAVLLTIKVAARNESGANNS